jgi:hypothetical protein
MAFLKRKTQENSILINLSNNEVNQAIEEIHRICDDNAITKIPFDLKSLLKTLRIALIFEQM